MSLSRRSFLGALGAASAVAALPAPLKAKPRALRTPQRLANYRRAGKVAVGDTFTIEGVHSYRYDITWGKKVVGALQQFRVVGEVNG